MTPKRQGVLVFLAIAFAGTWSYLFTARLLLGWSLANPLVQMPVAFMPARKVSREALGKAARRSARGPEGRLR